MIEIKLKRALYDILMSIETKLEHSKPTFEWGVSYTLLLNDIVDLKNRVKCDLDGKTDFDYNEIYCSYLNGKSPSGDMIESLKRENSDFFELFTRFNKAFHAIIDEQ